MRSLLPLVTATLLIPLMGGALAGSPPPVTYIVGFHDLPADARDAGSWGPDRVLRSDRALGFLVIETRDTRGLETRAAQDPNVRYAHRDAPDALQAHIAINDPLYTQQYAWANLNASAAWALTSGSTSILVAVLDSGIEASHEDLTGGRVLPGWSFVTNTANVTDDCGHGTHVAGTVGATAGNGRGGVGTAQVTILPVKVLSKVSTSCSGSFSGTASGIRWAADQGARIITMSLGCMSCFDQATADAIEYAWSKGAVLIASAGNSGPCTDCVGFPGNQPRIITVACTDNRDAQCTFSSRGPEVDVAAPGLAITSSYIGNTYKAMSGTSMSAPHVAGAAALALTAKPSLTNEQLRALVETSARDAGDAGFDDALGHGILDVGRLVSSATGPLPNLPPTASFTSTCSGFACAFDATGSSDPDGGTLTYAWDFGDGSTGLGANAQHTYASAGDHTVTLSVTDPAGANDESLSTIALMGQLHVSSIASSFDHSRKSHVITWQVRIVDDAGAPIAGASVSARITSFNAASSTLSATSGTNGIASFTHSDKTAKHGAFTLCVEEAALSGWAYDDASNAATCRTQTTS